MQKVNWDMLFGFIPELVGRQQDWVNGELYCYADTTKAPAALLGCSGAEKALQSGPLWV